MKTIKKVLLLVFASIILFTSVSTKKDESQKPKKMKQKNNVAGTWKLISGHLDNHGKQLDILGPHPGGMVIFTKDLHFMVIVHNPDIAKFASGDRANGTPEEYKAAVTNSLGVYGTYTIDENGDFLEQHVIGSTFQNMNGSSRGRSELTEKIAGIRMTENLRIADGVTINIVWERVH